MSPSPRSLGGGRALALIGIVLVAINLRTAVGAISPIIGSIEKDLPLGAVLLGLIGASPPLVFALSGFIGPLVSRRLNRGGSGIERAILVSMVVMVAGHLLRAFAPAPALLLIGTALALLGAGVANVLLPPIVKKYFPDRVGTATAIYVTVMSIGASLPPVIAVPVDAAAGWRTSLLVWAATGVLAVAPWVVELVRSRRSSAGEDRSGSEADPPRLPSMIRSRIAWSTGLMFGVAAISAYAGFAWLPTLLVDTAGVDAAQAGLLLGLFAIIGFPSALLVPVVATRLKSQAPIIVFALASSVVGYLGLLFAPAAAPVAWVVLVGVGTLLFPLGLTLINLRSRTQAGSVALSGFVQGVGYIVGATGPLVVGLLHDATAGWTVPEIFLLSSLVLAVPALFVLARPHVVEDELASRS